MKTIIVVGNGMVGYKFCEKFVIKEESKNYKLIVFGEEPRPAYDRVHLSDFFQSGDAKALELAARSWYKAAAVDEFPENGGLCVKYKEKQIAVFNFTRKKTWYACQNACPHKMEMVLSRGMLGDDKGIAKIACPMHKNTFSLETGENLNGDMDSIATYPVKIEDGFVFVGFCE